MLFNPVTVDGVTYYVSASQVSFYDLEKHLKVDPRQSLGLPAWRSFTTSQLAQFGFTGSVWTALKIACAAQAVWTIHPGFTGQVQTFDKTFAAWGVIK